MMRVNEVSKLTGVSIRTLQYYDNIGLLKATEVTDAGYRLYDDAALQRLEYILLFRELELPLKDIRTILDSPGFDREKALEQQLAFMEMKRNRLNNLIDLVRDVKAVGGIREMNFRAFDTSVMDEFLVQAKTSWRESTSPSKT